MVTVLGHEGLNAPGLVDTLITAIKAQIATYMVVPGPPGYTSCRSLLNHGLSDAANREDTLRFKALLEERYAEGLTRLNETRPVVLTA